MDLNGFDFSRRIEGCPPAVPELKVGSAGLGNCFSAVSMH